MIIDNAQVAMTSASEQVAMKSYKVSMGVETKTIGEWLEELAPEDLGLTQAENPVRLDISADGKRAAEIGRVTTYDPLFEQMEDLRIQLMRAMYKMLTGKDLPIKQWRQPEQRPEDRAWERLSQAYAKSSDWLQKNMSRSQSGDKQNDTQLTGRLVSGRLITGSEKDLLKRKLSLDVTRRTETAYASEKVQFSMSAQVNTADGKSINVQIDLSMSQEFYSRVDTLVARSVKDPLVINFNGTSAALSDTKFNFDIDCDGTEDQISQLAAGSGFLAVDWDDSGTVKDGGQLFGTQNGNGFADLARYDNDGNGWIDENDSIFDKLRIWTWDETGSSKLIGLGEVGIGAICLSYANTQYSLQQQGQTNGYLRSTGFFLRENGTAGTVQHVDMVV